MKTQDQLIKSLSPAFNEGLMKAIALKQYNNEDYFLIKDGKEIKAFEGVLKDEQLAFLDFKSSDKNTHPELVFEAWAINSLSEIEPIEGDEERENYIVLTDVEADEKAKEYIEQSLWAFGASFLSAETGIDIAVFEAIHANGKCEDNNDAIASCIEDLDSFVESAISADGRGHFMSSYDGNENKERVNGVTFYIYRIN